MDNIRSWLEIVYFLCGPLILIVSILGLKQIKIAKDTLKTSSKRDALRLAAEQCQNYCDHIIPLQNTFHQAVGKHNVLFFKRAKVDISEGGCKVQVRYEGITNKDMADLEKVSSETLAACNAMEGFSVYFSSNVADENTAFLSVGKTFCQTTQYLLPTLAQDYERGYFKHLMQLFSMWYSRIEAEKLAKQKHGIEEKLKTINTNTCPPFGTED